MINRLSEAIRVGRSRFGITGENADNNSYGLVLFLTGVNATWSDNGAAF